MSHPLEEASQKFAEIVSEKTDGAVEVEVYGNTQLGEEREMVEGLQLGTVDAAIVSTGPISGFVPEIGVVDLPFLFSSKEHAYEVLDGEIGQNLLDRFKEQGIVGLTFMENGWRHITANKKIESPADLEGLKIRTMENDVHIAAFKALGANPNPMAWGEVYTGLQQGVIDGQENPIPIIYTNALWEVQDYTALTNHFYTPYVFLMSQATFDKLSEEQQQVVLDASKEVTQLQRELMAKASEEQIESLKEEGMEVYEVDTQPFKEATKEVYEQFEDKFGKDLIQQIEEMGQ